MTSQERNEQFILEEYAAHGFHPHRAANGMLVSLGLARKLGVDLVSVDRPNSQAAE